MDELTRRLNAIPDTYSDFVAAITSYASRTPERLQKVLNYLDTEGDLTTADVIRFISDQPDFYEYAAPPEEKVG